MSQIRLESDDDTSDEEYVPGGEDCAQLSEVESDGDPEDDCNSENESNSKHRKRKSKSKTKRSKKPKTVIEEKESDEEQVNKELSEEEQKKKTDSLWADFLKDTDFKPKSKSTTTVLGNEPTLASKPETKLIKEKQVAKKETAPIILEFAGERVNIPEKTREESSEKQGTSSPSLKLPVKKPQSGISSLLSQLGKKQKITTLEKSKLDWDQFKEEENISDELRAFNKGKNGYLERQDFLQRADLRQFELEKKARAIQRTNRS